jgi:hypothetical protein
MSLLRQLFPLILLKSIVGSSNGAVPFCRYNQGNDGKF